MRVATLARVGLLAGVALAFFGCSGSDVPPLGTVHGVVTFDGQPYSSARVTFTPAKGRPSQGVTDSEGKYELTYLPKIKGAEIGEHTVSIQTNYQAPENPDGGAPFVDPLPAKYNTKTTLKKTVEKGDNTHNFELDSGH